MPFGIPSEDFHGGFGLPHDDEYSTDTVITNVDDTDGDWIEDDWTDEEYKAVARETHNNLVRSLVEAGGEIDSLNNDKRRLVYALNETVKWLNYFLTRNRDDVYYDEAHEARWRAEYLLMDLEE